MSKKNDCVLSIYSIKSNHINSYTDFQQIWDDFVEAKAPDVSCREVVRFQLAANELLKLAELRDFPQEVNAILKDEFDLGANVAFIQPVVGKPIGGFFLSNLVSN